LFPIASGQHFFGILTQRRAKTMAGEGSVKLKNMEIINHKIKNLKPAEYNPRFMSEEDLEKLKNSVKEFGMVEPIVVNKDLTVIGGHQRIKAVEMLGWEEIPCIMVDLDKRREKLLNLALNRIVGSWDEGKLTKLIREIRDYPEIKLSGLSDAELEMLGVQYDLIFGEDVQDLENEETIKRMFDLNMRVPIDVERPQVMKRENKVAFYTEDLNDWKKIKEHFQTDKKSELDTKRLLDLIK
jgi:hypothetical protein